MHLGKYIGKCFSYTFTDDFIDRYSLKNLTHLSMFVGSFRMSSVVSGYTAVVMCLVVVVTRFSECRSSHNAAVVSRCVAVGTGKFRLPTSASSATATT